MTFLCGVCKTQLQTPDEHAGKVVQCPKCRTTLRAPTPQPAMAMAGGHVAPTSSNAPPLPRPAPASPGRPMGGKRYGFNCQYCSSRLETVDSLAGSEGSCPTCGQPIIIPILDRYGRLIDPMTGKVIKQDPHPVHAYAAAGERAPKVVRRESGAPGIQCPKCKSMSPITANNCKQCGMPFTMEGTTADAPGATNGFAITSVVMGVIGILTSPTIVLGVIFGGGAVTFGLIGRNQAARDNGPGGGAVAITGTVLGGIGLAIGLAYMLGLIR